MKKSAYKLQIQNLEYKLGELNKVIANLIDKVVDVSERNELMLELVNRDQPKSMKDMAKVIMDHASKNDGGWYSEDEAMDILLEIIG